MRLKFKDNRGSEETILFNPQVNFYSDGSIIINETVFYLRGKRYEMPLFAGEVETVWADVQNNRYSNSELGNAPNAVRIIYRSGNAVCFHRYKKNIDETIVEKTLRKLHEISQFWKYNRRNHYNLANFDL